MLLHINCICNGILTVQQSPSLSPPSAGHIQLCRFSKHPFLPSEPLFRRFRERVPAYVFRAFRTRFAACARKTFRQHSVALVCCKNAPRRPADGPQIITRTCNLVGKNSNREVSGLAAPLTYSPATPRSLPVALSSSDSRARPARSRSGTAAACTACRTVPWLSAPRSRAWRRG